MTTQSKIYKGGEFLISNMTSQEIFTKSQLSDEAHQFAEMIQEFVEKKINPNIVKMDKGNYDLLVELLKECGSLGMIGAALPEQYGGMNIDFNTESVMSEEIGKSHSFSVAYAAHTGIGTLPILYYGTEEQKNKYLEKLGSGEKFSSYCLTEPWSGSDALGAKTKAILTDDGNHYILNGQKMWITNAGFADIFIVFAQVDGDKFTGFIVEKGTEGFNLGEEEDKLGIKGSSTRQVFLENVKIPVGNILGELGKGHKIAFNVLNIGRYKLCVMTLGAAKRAFKTAITYANERVQFGQPISKFGAIQEKIAQMAIKLYITEAATYRTSGQIELFIENLVAQGESKPQAKLKAAEEYSIECAILKVLGSETLDYVVDENVQIYGGMGFSEEAPAARAYRDSRINRIFEGTNEINRLLAVGTLMKKGLKGELNLIEPAMNLQKELMNFDMGSAGEGLMATELKAIENAKKCILLVAGAAMKHYERDIKNQQEIIMKISDMIIELFAMESALLNAKNMIEIEGEAIGKINLLMTQTAISEGMDKLYLLGKSTISGFAEGDILTMTMMGVKRFSKYPLFNTIAAKKEIAKHFIEKGEY